MILQYSSGTIAAELKQGRRTLVEGVRFSLEAGESLGLIGETGSGKTMIAMSILDLLPSNVTVQAQQICFCGSSAPTHANRRIGIDLVYIPKNGHEFLNPSRKVRGHLFDSLEKLGVKPRQRESAAREVPAAVGFADPERIMGYYPFQLSGGMAQRVTIAIAACSTAKLVIADEPTNGLDESSKAGFMERICRLFPSAGKLVITHDIAVAGLCSKTLVLCRGRMMEFGPSDQVLTDPRHPYTQALLGALVENGMEQTPVLRSSEGDCPFQSRCPRWVPGCRWQQRRAGERQWWCSQSDDTGNRFEKNL